MRAESLLQIQNNYSKNVTFEILITYMEYGFYHYACHQVLEDHYLVAHALLKEQNQKIYFLQGLLIRSYTIYYSLSISAEAQLMKGLFAFIH